jgi:glutamyl-Q tRNA(Asp) synthetase
MTAAGAGAAGPQAARVFRFAPSPNGYLHLGHAYSALFNLKLARACGGTLLLRIEDIDPDRSRRLYEDALLEDLAWLGFVWSGTPRRQSEHIAEYRVALDDLARRGLVYPCFCSRGDIAKRCAANGCGPGFDWPRDPDNALVYPGTCRQLAEGERAARIAAGARQSWRLDMEKAIKEIAGPLTFLEFREGDKSRIVTAEPSVWGDAMIGRRDAPTSYHLACVLDDHAQGVTDVVRGVDLEAATSLHRLLQALLGLCTPSYRHHRLVLDEQGRKLSKSKSSASLRDLRKQGVSARQIRMDLSRRMQVEL